MRLLPAMRWGLRTLIFYPSPLPRSQLKIPPKTEGSYRLWQAAYSVCHGKRRLRTLQPHYRRAETPSGYLDFLGLSTGERLPTDYRLHRRTWVSRVGSGRPGGADDCYWNG